MCRFTLLLMLTLLITVSASQGQTPSSAADYYQRGETRLRKGDLDGAIADFTQAVKLDPGMARAYAGRGEARYYKKDFDGAIAGYSEALELFDFSESVEFYSTVHVKRGLARIGKGDSKGAMADLTEAIQYNPKSADAYYHRGGVQSDIDGAIADYTKAIGLAPKWAAPYYSRMWEHLFSSRGEAAHKDAAEYLRLINKMDEHSTFAVIIGYFGLRQSRQDAAAKAFLDEWFRRANASLWPYPVLRYLRREITAPDLLRLATDNDKMTEARSYIGEDLLLAGQRDAGLEHLRWVRQNGNKKFGEYRLADYELRRLEAAQSAGGGQKEAQRSQGLEAGSEWEPDLLKEWKRNGGKNFQSVPASQPHATIWLRDSSDRSGLVPLGVWVLVDGEMNREWTERSPLRLSPGPHCIRVGFVGLTRRGLVSKDVGTFTPWLEGTYEGEVQITGSKARVTVKYETKTRVFTLEDSNAEELKFLRGLPQDPKAAYAYCLKYVHARRSR